MNDSIIKLIIGAVLFGTWVALVVFKVAGAEEIITTIKIFLSGLAGWHIRDAANKPTSITLAPSGPSLAAAVVQAAPAPIQPAPIISRGPQ